MSIDQKHGRYCDECGRTIRKAHRVFQEKDYCSSCYARVFIAALCMKCGASVRIHRLSQGSTICRSCAHVGRVCVRCEKPIVKAGMISEGKPVCSSCVPHFRTPQPCSACGTMSTRLSAMATLGIHDKLCESCRNKITHRTCSVCRKYRKVAGVTAAEKPYCSACIPGKAVTHPCPDCHVELPGSGQGRCRPCLNRIQLEREANLLAAAMTHDWIRPYCIDFAQWLWQRQPENPRLMATYRSHQPIIEQMDAYFACERDISAAALLNAFGTSTLRRHLLVTQYFQDVLGLPISSAQKSEIADLERIRAKLFANKRSPWGTVLHEYAAWLKNEGVSSRTRRLYIGTAEAFCRAVLLADVPWMEDRARKFVRLHPGATTNLSKFIGYCRRVRGWDVTMPDLTVARVKRTGLPNTVSYLKKLLGKIDDVGIDAVDPTTLCRIMARSLGLTINAMQRVTRAQFKDDGRTLTLIVDAESITIPVELTAIARAYMACLAKP